MGDISTNKHYSDDAVRGWREGERGEVNGRKKERAFMCKRLCCMDIVSSHFFLY